MKMLAVNGSPRRDHNTGLLLEKVVAGARDSGCEADLVHLRDLSPFVGCISCFNCKLVGGRSYGRCSVKDGLRPVLDLADAADVLVLGSPLYFMVDSALMRAFMERLWFQYHRYSLKGPLSKPKRATALLYTMNVSEDAYRDYVGAPLVEWNKSIMARVFGSCETFMCYDTKQFDDYSRFEADYFDVPSKLKRHEEVFPLELNRAYDFGWTLAGNPMQ